MFQYDTVKEPIIHDHEAGIVIIGILMCQSRVQSLMIFMFCFHAVQCGTTLKN